MLTTGESSEGYVGVPCTILPCVFCCSSEIFIKKWEIQKLNLSPVTHLCKYVK